MTTLAVYAKRQAYNKLWQYYVAAVAKRQRPVSSGGPTDTLERVRHSSNALTMGAPSTGN